VRAKGLADETQGHQDPAAHQHRRHVQRDRGAVHLGGPVAHRQADDAASALRGRGPGSLIPRHRGAEGVEDGPHGNHGAAAHDLRRNVNGQQAIVQDDGDGWLGSGINRAGGPGEIGNK